MQNFLEKNQVNLFCFALFLIMLIGYQKCSKYNAEKEARLEAEMKTQDSLLEIEGQRLRESVELDIQREKQIKLQENKFNELMQAEKEIHYYFSGFAIDSLGFVKDYPYEYYIYDVFLKYNEDESKTSFNCKDGKGDCIKHTYKEDDSYSSPTLTETISSFSYNNQTKTEFEKSFTAFNRYRKLLKEYQSLKNSKND